MKTRKKIKEAIDKNDLSALKKIQCEDILNFSYPIKRKDDNGLNVLFMLATKLNMKLSHLLLNA